MLTDDALFKLMLAN